MHGLCCPGYNSVPNATATGSAARRKLSANSRRQKPSRRNRGRRGAKPPPKLPQTISWPTGPRTTDQCVGRYSDKTAGRSVTAEGDLGDALLARFAARDAEPSGQTEARPGDRPSSLGEMKRRKKPDAQTDAPAAYHRNFAILRNRRAFDGA